MGASLFRGGIQQKPTPPLVRQPIVTDADSGIRMISSTCWAAALSSWLSSSRNDDRTVENLVQWFRVGQDGLDLGKFDQIADAPFVRMQFEEVGKAQMTWDYLSLKLHESAVYVILINANPAHAVVLYAITQVAGQEHEVWIMDPIQGYRVGSLSGFRERSPTFLIGVAKKG